MAMAKLITDDQTITKTELYQTPLHLIDPNPYQSDAVTNRHLDSDFEQFAQSIHQNKHSSPTGHKGLLQIPIARLTVDYQGQRVQPTWDAKTRKLIPAIDPETQELLPNSEIEYGPAREVKKAIESEIVRLELKFGHGRKLAFDHIAQTDTDYAKMPLIISPSDDYGMWQIVIVENLQRKAVDPLNEARVIEQGVKAFGKSVTEVGKGIGLSRSAASNRMRLLSLPQKAIDLIDGQLITHTHGRTLLKLNDHPQHLVWMIDQLETKAMEETLPSVKELEQHITNLIAQETVSQETPIDEQPDPPLVDTSPQKTVSQETPPPTDTPNIHDPHLANDLARCFQQLIAQIKTQGDPLLIQLSWNGSVDGFNGKICYSNGMGKPFTMVESGPKESIINVYQELSLSNVFEAKE